MIDCVATTHVDTSVGSSQLKSAIAFAQLGWPVLPLHFPFADGRCSCGKKDCTNVGKHPMTRHGFKDASADINAIIDWWAKAPRANLGIRTGQETGFVVIDIDPRHNGEESLVEVEARYENLPETLKVRTGGSGWHYYFLHPGTRVSNKVNVLPGIDVRGDGAYIIAPPSVHRSLVSYAWVNPGCKMAPMPPWLLELILSNAKPPKPSSKQHEHKAEGFLSDGCRADSMMSLGGFLKAKGLAQMRLMKALSAVNETVCSPPLSSEQMAGIGKS